MDAMDKKIKELTELFENAKEQELAELRKEYQNFREG